MEINTWLSFKYGLPFRLPQVPVMKDLFSYSHLISVPSALPAQAKCACAETLISGGGLGNGGTAGIGGTNTDGGGGGEGGIGKAGAAGSAGQFAPSVLHLITT